MTGDVDELAVQRLKTKITKPEIAEAVADAVDAWMDYQAAREQLAHYTRALFKDGYQMAAELAGGLTTAIDQAAEQLTGVQLDASLQTFLQSGRVIEALVDDLIIPAIEVAEAQLAAEDEEADSVCRHQRARIDDGAPTDALVVPCAIVELFGIQTGELVPDITCPGCGGALKFRIWRLKEPKWAVALPEDFTDLTGMGVGPWLQCTGCDGW